MDVNKEIREAMAKNPNLTWGEANTFFKDAERNMLHQRYEECQNRPILTKMKDYFGGNCRNVTDPYMAYEFFVDEDGNNY